jgi:hypothetical protein
MTTVATETTVARKRAKLAQVEAEYNREVARLLAATVAQECPDAVAVFIDDPEFLDVCTDPTCTVLDTHGDLIDVTFALDRALRDIAAHFTGNASRVLPEYGRSILKVTVADHLPPTSEV